MTIPRELFDTSVALEGNQWNEQLLSAIPPCKGLLLFADSAGRPIQLLQSANLRRTAQARLCRAEPSEPVRKADISALTTTIYLACCCNDFQTALSYLRISTALRGASIEEMKLPSPSFAAVDLNAPLPYFYVSSNPAVSNSRSAWGLFASRRDAQEFCTSMNRAFGLCRDPALLQTGREESCSYLQMRQCLGPCIERLPRDRYMEWVTSALAAADGEMEQAIAALTAAMRQAAADKRYEQAQDFRERIDLLRQLQGPRFLWTENLRRFCLLHADRGPKVQVDGQKRKQQQFTAWKITNERIFEIGQFVLTQGEQWTARFNEEWGKPSKPYDLLSPQEHFGLLSLLLYRSRPQGIWLNASHSVPALELVLHRAAELTQKKEDAEPNSPSSEL
ncbi:MAG: hypothetical protein LLF76_13315 [Planctomycetaceae bacterium]|nr:hypothetical protein [Planctomycetaceae bacterium]